ncbi:hypothetical protein AAFF_G00420320 [Aldrovandia affinis]|uniref:Uncharacterized protein n=1 Tax=Aldrovandia affinis TaxID=143900 RepID=A0AAD7R374_9TELE|nr:hypothetical protein AAFF_G00420320 [Aldrovandia affinis]
MRCVSGERRHLVCPLPNPDTNGAPHRPCGRLSRANRRSAALGQTPHLPLSPERVAPGVSRALDARSESPLGARLPASPDLHPRRLHPARALGFRAHRGGPPTRRGVALEALVAGDGRVGRPICTSGPLRTSTRVSSGFALPRHSSPSFGSYRTHAHAPPPDRAGETGRWCAPLPRAGGRGSHLSRRAPALTFIAPRGVEQPSDSRAR